MKSRLTIAVGLLGATLGLIRPASADVVIYSNDFSTSAGSEWSDNTIATSNGEKFLGTNQYGFGNGTNTLTLTGIIPHDMVTVSFDLYIIQSWDGNGPAGGGPDNWGLTQNGNTLVYTSFANYSGSGNVQSYSLATPTGVPYNNPARTDQFASNHLGFGDGDFGDATYRLTYTFASTSSTLIFDFTSYQNQSPGDEGWGLDNVVVSVSPTAAVPEPSSLVLCGLGVVGVVGGLARSRRRSA